MNTKIICPRYCIHCRAVIRDKIFIGRVCNSKAFEYLFRAMGKREMMFCYPDCDKLLPTEFHLLCPLAMPKIDVGVDNNERQI